MSNLTKSRGLDDLFRADSLFEQMFGGGVVRRDYSWLPRDYSWLPRDGGGYDLSLAVPGYSKDDIAVTLDGNILSINGSVDTSLPNGITSERISKKYTLRDVHLYDLDKIEASVKNGVLTISIPPKNPNNSSGGSISIPVK